MIVVKQPTALIFSFIWVGFIGAISFMEAWLKFRAPGVDLPIGLGIGRLVFTALNLMEWIFSTLIITSLLFNKWPWKNGRTILILIPFVLLIIQSIWLLPALDIRAELHITGATVPASNLHFYYVGMEMIKIISLILWGLKLFITTRNEG